ncbi:MAG: dipeptidase [Sphingomonadaceae bacterium]|nr:dipeptidase [Sphingomonadaceae bacterium]
MIRRIVLIVIGLLIAAALLFFTAGPIWLEWQMNQREQVALPEVSEEARQLHGELVIADMHADTLLWRRDPLRYANRGHADLRRLERGNVALQIFSSVTKSPAGLNYDSNPSDSDNLVWLVFAQLQPTRTWNSLLERSLWHATRLERAEERSAGRLRIIHSAADIGQLIEDRADRRRVTGAMLSVEGLHNLEGDFGNLNRLYEAGFRMASPTHFFDNELGGSMHGEEKGGLTDFGRRVIRAMEVRGMIVDIAHASRAMVSDILAMARRPVVSSHGGVQAICDVNRNLSDAQIRAVAQNGGVIGIGYWEGAICSYEPERIVDSILHVRALVGTRHVGLGSDYDGSTTVGFDTSQIAVITQLLIDRGVPEDEIAAIMGGNVVRLLREGLPQR